MNVIVAATGKWSHATPPQWFMVLGVAATFLYWLYLRASIRRRHKPDSAKHPDPP
jgi:hypothetical protein